jgi:hypothetical protein
MKKKIIILFTAILLILVAGYFYHEKKQLDISAVRWNYANGVCKVSFIVSNYNIKQTTHKLSIRAYKQERISNAIVSNIVGEKFTTVEVLAGKKKKINVKMDILLGLNPDIVVVSAWKKD